MLISVQLDFELLKTSILEKFNDPLALSQNNEFSASFTDVQIIPLSELELNAKENQIASFLSLELHLKLNRGKNSLLRSLPSMERVSMQIHISTMTSIGITSDWKMRSSTRAAFSWEQLPSWGNGMIKLPLTGIFTSAIEKELNRISKLIDTTLEQDIPLQSIALDSWKSLHQAFVISLSERTNLHLRFNPTPNPIKLGRIQISSSKLGLPLDPDVGECSVSLSPISDLKTEKIPHAVLHKLPDRQQSMQIDSHFSFENINQLIEDLLMPLSLDQGLSIQSLDLSASQKDEAHIKLHLEGSYRGFPLHASMEINCHVQWISTQESISCKVLHVKMEEANVWARLLSVLGSNWLKNTIEHQIIHAVREGWQWIKDNMYTSLQASQLEEGVELRVKDLLLILKRVSLDEKGVSFLLKIRGKPVIQLTELKL